MGTDNKIDACYMTQAQNLFKKLKLDPKGVSVKLEAMQLFSSLHFCESKYSYIESVDTNKDSLISVQELASVFQRADKEGRSGKLAYDNTQKNDGITDKTELLSDFVQHGAIPYLLSETKKHAPEAFPKIKERLTKGVFSITGEQDYNLRHNEQYGINLTTMVSEATNKYESLIFLAPNFKKMFFDNLASGIIAQYDVEANGKELKVKQDQVNVTRLGETEILQTETAYAIDNPQKPITTSKPYPVPKLKYAIPKTLLERFKSDSFENFVATTIREKVLTPQQVKKYEKEFSKALKDKESFTQFTQNLGAKINQALGINPSLFITNEDFKDKAGHYDSAKKEVVISYPKIPSLQKSLESVGVPDEKIKRELFDYTIGLMVHEYGHAAQYAFIENPPQSPTPEEKTIIADYRQNSKEFLFPKDSETLYGSIDKYMTQPLENNSFGLMIDTKNHTNKILKNNSDKQLSTKTRSACKTKQGV